MTRYRVVHRTDYRYADEVEASYGHAHLLPREHAHQRIEATDLTIEPVPGDRRDRLDFFGNRATYFSIHDPHRRLTVTSTSIVEVDDPGAAAAPALPLAWEDAAARTREAADAAGIEARGFVLDSPLVQASAQLREYAGPSFAPGRDLRDAARDLCSRIHHDFEFDASATDVSTTIEEVFDVRRGVCQDFAHLAIGCLRSLGLAARYVSGYLETDPPPGEPRLQGADVSHAWFGLYVPGAGWLDLDPTNDQLVGDRHVTTGWGRDYSDIAPLKGIIFTEGESHELSVEVDVVRIGD